MNKVDSMRREIAKRLEESAQIKRAIARSKISEIERMVNFIITAYKTGGKVVLFGNGGSAADAQHLAGELVGQFALKRQAFSAIALTTNTSVLTGVANDYGYDAVFSRQIDALVNEKDVVIGIRTSGNSPNVIEAIMKYAPDGTVIAEISIGVGGGSAKYPVMWVNVPVWDKLAEEALKVIDKKGIAVEARGMLLVRLYEGKHGTAVAIELKNVREIKIYNRDGELEKVLSAVAKAE